MTQDEMIKRLKNGEDKFDLSIEKWQDIIDKKGTDVGCSNCALCFSCFCECEDCPFACSSGTAYSLWSRHIEKNLGASTEKLTKTGKRLATAVRDDLIKCKAGVK